MNKGCLQPLHTPLLDRSCFDYSTYDYLLELTSATNFGPRFAAWSARRLFPINWSGFGTRSCQIVGFPRAKRRCADNFP